LTNIETLNLALEALERYAPQHGHPDDMSDAITALRTAIEQVEKNDLERLMSENERLHVENRRLIDRIEVMGVPVGVGGYLTTTTTPTAAQQKPVSGNYVESPDKRWRIDPVTGNVGIGTPPAAQREPAPGYCKHCKQYTIEEPLPAAQRQPLTDDRIGQIIEQCKITLVNYCSGEKQTEFARAIEAAHGITGEKT
jgi:hypothetical protein